MVLKNKEARGNVLKRDESSHNLQEVSIIPQYNVTDILYCNQAKGIRGTTIKALIRDISSISKNKSIISDCD